MGKSSKGADNSADENVVVRRNTQVMRNTVGVSLTLPIELNQELTETAVGEHKTKSLVVSELLQEALAARKEK